MDVPTGRQERHENRVWRLLTAVTSPIVAGLHLNHLGNLLIRRSAGPNQVDKLDSQVKPETVSLIFQVQA